MATTPAPQTPSSGDPSEAANPGTASAPSDPARIWSSHFAGPPPSKDTRLLAAVSDHHRRLFRGRRSQRPTLPLPIYRPPILYAGNTDEIAIARAILEDIAYHTLSSLHTIQEILLYWQSRAEETRLQKMYFMTFQRGPRAFAEAACQMLSRLRSNRSPVEYLLDSANCMLFNKLARLKSMKRCLAAFLAEVYSEVSKHMGGSPESSDKSLHTLFIVLNRVFPKLEASLRNADELQTLLFTHDGNSSELLFERFPEVDVECSEWTEALSTDAINLIYQNLQKLDSFVSSQTISLKELFQTYKRTDELAMEQEIQQSDGSLRRMLLAFCEKNSHEKLPQDVSTQALMEIAMKRYMEESIHPIQNVLSGGLANAMLIQIHELKVKLRLQKSRLLLKQLVETNRRQVAIVAALPAFGLSLLLLRLVRALLAMHDRGGRIARHQRTLLLLRIDRMLMKSRRCMDNGTEEEVGCNFGLILYSLDCLYKDVEPDARRTGEWSSVREDIIELANPHLGTEDQLFALSRLQDMYACIFQSPCPGPAYHQLQGLRSSNSRKQS